MNIAAYSRNAGGCIVSAIPPMQSASMVVTIQSFTGHNFCETMTDCPGGGASGAIMVENEFFGLPEFVVNEVVTETAGGENVRIYNFVRRGTLLVPQFMVLMNATEMLVAGRAVAGAAQAVFNGEIQELTKAARH